MAQQQQQEDRQKNSNNKKAKERKVPQRGLGVAQLEKIRLESQKKPPPTPTPPPPQSHHTSCSAIQSPPSIFRHNSLPSPTSISFPPPPPPPPPTAADLVQRNAILRRASSTPSVGFGHLQPGPLPFPNTEVGNRWPVISNRNHQVQPSHHLLLTYLPNMNLAYDTRPVHPSQNVILQRPPQVQEQPSPSSLVNVRPPPPPTSSTPPVITNQSIYDKNYSVVWSEAKIAGMKRPYPFSLDPSNPSLPSKLPQMVAPGVKTLDQPGSGVTGSVGNAEMSNLVFREGSSTPTQKSAPNPKVTGRENGGQNRDFLALVPPRTASSTLDNREIVDLESPSFQGSVGQPDHPPGPSDHQKPLYSFFPPSKAETTSEETARSTGGGSKEAGEKLDLSLKL